MFFLKGRWARWTAIFLLFLCVGCAAGAMRAPEPIIADRSDEIAAISAGTEAETAGEVADSMAEEVPDLPVFKLSRGKRVAAVQVLLFNCKDLDEVEAQIRSLKAAGFNTLIFRVFQNRGDRLYPFAEPAGEVGVYFNTSHAPVVDDLLGKVAEISHRNDMDIYAWMTTRYADYGVEDKDAWHEVSYDLESNSFKRAKGLNLFNSEVKNHLKKIYRDLARYDIDGVLFQDDLVSRHTEGFSEDARKEYARFCGRMPDPEKFYLERFEGTDGRTRVSEYGEEFWEWCRWKNRNLVGMAKELMEEVRGVNPDVKFAINLMYEAALSPKNALSWLSQDLEEAVRADFDLFAVMAYHRQMGKELGLTGKAVEKAIGDLVRNTLEKVGSPHRALIKLQIADWESGSLIPPGEIEDMLKAVREEGATSLAFVPYRPEFDFDRITPYLRSGQDLIVQK